MNDTELDRLLDTWKAPAPPRTLRAGLKDRFPRTGRSRVWHPLRWALVVAVASATLAVGTGQRSGNPIGWVFQRLHGWYEAFMFGVEAQQASTIAVRIKQSNPLVYVDGQMVAPPWRKGGGSLWVEVPGDGVYGIVLIPTDLPGFVEAGRLHGNVLEFQAGGKQVRIVCNQAVVDSDRPVYVRREP